MSQAVSATNLDQMRVAARPKPEINIGPVDLSCAFVVCDINRQDMPIVYCSDIFERLTGYSNMEIVGRNCRFLQAPDGKVHAGQRRKYVDDTSVFCLKTKIRRREEIQLSLINYRKGGQPFMNLLTMIPIPWESAEYRYYVGFQVDLVEQPGSVAGKNPGKICHKFSLLKVTTNALQMAPMPSIINAVNSLPTF
jgi:PAS domain-containing protein